MRLPDGILGMASRGDDWAAWVDALPSMVEGLLDEWHLTTDGWMMHGFVALVVPVRTTSNRPAVLKVSFPDEESQHEHLALQHWHGRGAVQLLKADPHRQAMLLERLHPERLTEVWDLEACEIVAGLYAQLHVPAIPQLRPLTEVRRPLGRRAGRAPTQRAAAEADGRAGGLARHGTSCPTRRAPAP